MLDARRWAIAAVTLALLGLPTGAGAAPAAPGQEEAGEDRSPGEFAMVSIDNLSISTVTTTLGELHAEVERQLGLLGSAHAAVAAANQALADADKALSDVQFRISELTNQTDTLVIDQFVNPPAASALDVLTAETTEDATVKQAILDMQADQAAVDLEAFEAARADLDVLEEQQQAAQDAAEAARADAEATVADLDAALSQQARFVSEVQEALAAGIRPIAYVLPLTWFIQIARATMLRGSDLAAVAFPFAMLGLIGATIVVLALLRFRHDLDPRGAA